MGKDVSFTCTSHDCTWEYSVHSGGSYSNPSNKAGVSVLGGYLEIEDVVADHEGIYRCVYNGGQDIFNLTVVGKTSQGSLPYLLYLYIVYIIFIYFGHIL